MELFDLREHDREEVLQTVMDRGTTKYQLTYDDRALQFTVNAYPPIWNHYANHHHLSQPYLRQCLIQIDRGHGCQGKRKKWASFAFQPIVDPFACEIISWEALLRTPDGQSPAYLPRSPPGDDIYASVRLCAVPPFR
ncbi:hypothetical protein KAM622c_35260 [Klebsiella quasipneumoniae subsp. quasipneumoniae]|nr:hypothetical protein KAM622c_35260 [Klebsiella quasipneumoniae subsp. quasipneumoniae]